MTTGLELPPREELKLALMLLVAGRDASRESPIEVPFVSLAKHPAIHPILVFGEARYATERTSADGLFQHGTCTRAYAGHYWNIERALDELDALRVDARCARFPTFGEFP